MLALHTVRQGWKKERTELVNRSRGLLSEFGLWFGRAAAQVLRVLPAMLGGDQLPASVRLALRQIRKQMALNDAQLKSTDAEILPHAKHTDTVWLVHAISGVGSVTASARVSTVAYASDFRNRQRMAAWLGLVPRPWSLDGKE